MYVSARLVLISDTSVGKYTQVIENTRRDVTAVALISVVRLIVVIATSIVCIVCVTLIPALLIVEQIFSVTITIVMYCWVHINIFICGPFYHLCNQSTMYRDETHTHIL